MDHSLWQSVLSKYVIENEDQINRVDYEGLMKSPARQNLKRYIAQQTSIDPRKYNRQEQLAYWINLYNALTVELVLNYPEKSSIVRMGEKFFSFGPWDEKVASIVGEEVSLNDIEHRILRPIWRDRRIHFAVNCASIGCPNLLRQAYGAENMQALLNFGEAQYINHARGVSFSGRGRLRISSIFDWFANDFAATDKALLVYLSEHHKSQAARILEYDKSIDYEYDWRLNSKIAR